MSRGPRPHANILPEPTEVPSHILIEQTIARFGHDPRFFKPSSCRLVITECVVCRDPREKMFRLAVTQTTCLRCANGARSRANAQLHSDRMRAYYAQGGVHAMQGRRHSPESRQRMGDRQRGRKLTSEQRAKITKALTGRVPSPETRRKLSEVHKGRNLGRVPAHAHKVWVVDLDGGEVCVRSTWEAAYARDLTARGVRWDYEPRVFPVQYTLDGVVREGTYRPDFYLPDTNEWIEVKGRWLIESRAKFDAFRAQYPDETITVVDRDYLTQRGLLCPGGRPSRTSKPTSVAASHG